MSLDFGMFAKLLVDAVGGAVGGGAGAKKEGYVGFAGVEDIPLAGVEDIPLIPRPVPEDLRVSKKWGLDASTFVAIALGAVIGWLAFYLSWSCNTAMGYSTAVKAVFGSFAFFFGLTYIVLYILLRWDVCARIGGGL